MLCNEYYIVYGDFREINQKYVKFLRKSDEEDCFFGEDSS